MNSTNVWRVPEVRPNKTKTIAQSLDPRTPNAYLSILPTGGGKTHTMMGEDNSNGVMNETE